MNTVRPNTTSLSRTKMVLTVRNSRSFQNLCDHDILSAYMNGNSKRYQTDIYTINGTICESKSKDAGRLSSIDVERNFSKNLLSEKPQELERQRLCQHFPIFLILISLLEIGIYLYDYITMKTQYNELLNGSTSVPSESMLVYRPDRRLEIWRFVSYMVLHANWFHLSFNVTTQLLFGIPLEMMHGSMRVAVIYFAGVFAGSLGTSVVDSAAYLIGASGGVYALLSAQLANILLNFTHLRYGLLQLISLLIFVCCDLTNAIYTKVFVENFVKTIPSVSYIAHLTGSLGGFSTGLLVLRHYDPATKSNLIWWMALTVYMSFTLFAIIFNFINTMMVQKLEEEGKLAEERLLISLGIS